MHEIGVAESILKTITTEANKSGAKEITKVHIKVGGLSGVEPNSLSFALEILKANTMAANAEFEIERIKVVGICGECGKESNPDSHFSMCGHCGSPALEIVAGEEFEISYIDID